MSEAKELYHCTEMGSDNVWLMDGVEEAEHNGEKFWSILDSDSLARNIELFECKGNPDQEFRFENCDGIWLLVSATNKNE